MRASELVIFALSCVFLAGIPLDFRELGVGFFECKSALSSNSLPCLPLSRALRVSLVILRTHVLAPPFFLPFSRVGPNKMSNANKVYIGNLNPRATERDIEDEFGRFGKLTNVWVARKPPGT